MAAMDRRAAPDLLLSMPNGHARAGTVWEDLCNLLPREGGLVHIDVAGEAADGDGVRREVWQLAAEKLCNEDYGLWQRDERTERLCINPASDIHNTHLDHFHAAGRLLGWAVRHGEVLPVNFSTALLKTLLEQPLSVGDLRDFDPDLYQTLQSLRALASAGRLPAGLTELSLDFRGCRVGDEGARAVAGRLPAGCRTRRLDRKLRRGDVSPGEALTAQAWTYPAAPRGAPTTSSKQPAEAST